MASYSVEKRLFHHVMCGFGIRAFLQPVIFEHVLDFQVEGQIPAHHRAVGFRVQRRHAQILEHLARAHQIGDPAHLGALFAGGRGVIAQLVGKAFADQFGQQFVLPDTVDQLLAVLQFAHFAAGMGDDDLVIVGIGLRIAQQRRKGRKARAGGKEPDPLAGQQRVMHQRAHGLGPQNDLVAGLDVLQFRCQRTVLDLDRVELQLLVPRGRGDRIGPQQRLAVVAHQPDHHELARSEPQRCRARAAETEKAVGPVPDVRYGLGVGQGRCLGGGGCGVGHVGYPVSITIPAVLNRYPGHSFDPYQIKPGYSMPRQS